MSNRIRSKLRRKVERRRGKRGGKFGNERYSWRVEYKITRPIWRLVVAIGWNRIPYHTGLWSCLLLNVDDIDRGSSLSDYLFLSFVQTREMKLDAWLKN